ncbi:MAG TPA: helix-turn-helix transcriptional regulator [Ktedonobacteraceae bacterium]|nr:helix-turn-helix transcriptional regulator [Ktedonobacteraceae bacterium]
MMHKLMPPHNLPDLPVSQSASSTTHNATKKAYDGLTEREREVTILIVQGKPNREIAYIMGIGRRTVETHISNIMYKMGFTSRTQIAVWAVKEDLTKH